MNITYILKLCIIPAKCLTHTDTKWKYDVKEDVRRNNKDKIDFKEEH
jgi:hypothetical protein